MDLEISFIFFYILRCHCIPVPLYFFFLMWTIVYHIFIEFITILLLGYAGFLFLCLLFTAKHVGS